MRTILALVLFGMLESACAQARSWDEIQRKHRESMAALDDYLGCSYSQLQISRPTMNVANARAAVEGVLAKCASAAEAVVAHRNLKSAEDIALATAEFQEEQRGQLLSMLGLTPKNGICDSVEAHIIAVAEVCKRRFPGDKFNFPASPLQCRNSEVDEKVSAKARLTDDTTLAKQCVSSGEQFRIGRMVALPY